MKTASKKARRAMFSSGSKFVRYLCFSVATVSFFIGWEIVGRTANLFAVPPFHVVASTLREMVSSGELWGPTMGTLEVAAAGYVVAAIVGIAVGVTLGISQLARDVLEPLVNAAYATPLAMFIPIIGIYLGLDFVGRTFLVVTFCVFIVLMNTQAGVKDVPAEYWELGRSMGMSTTMIVARIVMPAALPYMLVGLRISVARAVAGAITAELLMSTTNLGLYLSIAGSSFDFDRLIAGTFYVALLSIIPVGAAYLIERRLTARYR